MRTIKLRMIAASLLLALAAFGLGQFVPGDAGSARPSLASGVFSPHEFDGASYLLYVPSTVPTDRLSSVFVVLHGMGADPEGFAAGLVADAERNGWVMVVPHLPYGDWTNAESLKSEEKKQMAWLNALLVLLPEKTGIPVRDRALLYGFSRGAQLAHRFALAYPQRVMAAAIMSPGTYTLPVEHSAAYDNHAPLNFPVGVNDIDSYCGRSFNPFAVKEIPFWVGVGEQDNSPGDVPRMWDRYLGTTRVERARSFASSLSELGADVEMNVFPGLGHAESLDSRGSAVAFLREHEAELTAPATPADEVPWTLESFALALAP